MLLNASCSLKFYSETFVPSIFMLHPQSGNAQFVVKNELLTTPYTPVIEFPDIYRNLCQRIIIPAGTFTVESRVTVDCSSNIDVNIYAPWIPMPDLPDHVIQFLLPSRYCESDKFSELAIKLTRGLPPGYPQVQAICQWINSTIRYEYGTTNSSTSAADVLASGVGVCRDFTHLGITLCRSLDIPARMVAGYLYDLKPMDLHAWFEAFVGGRWYTFDATQTEPKGGRIVLAYGRDAADVAFVSHFGNASLKEMIINVDLA
jgi:transglutaminase-like putative cysteine protease